MVVTPVLASRSMRSILVANGMVFLSFCSPSRGPTSTILTRLEKEGAGVSEAVAKHRRPRAPASRKPRQTAGPSAFILFALSFFLRSRE